MRPADRLERMTEACERHPHGTRLRYRGGCRCLTCRAANSRYECERAAARRRGEHNGIVPAKKARRRILELARKGVGYKQVADASGVAETIVSEIRTGRKTRIRANTERAILGVTAEAMADHALVDAAPTWRRIERLIDEGGFTKSEIARRLGKKTPALQIGRVKVLAKTALAIEKMCRYYLERR